MTILNDFRMQPTIPKITAILAAEIEPPIEEIPTKKK